jgi:hypothetical protein
MQWLKNRGKGQRHEGSQARESLKVLRRGEALKVETS